ncbi:DUF4153 domain-containing protein [Marinomonas gallaica]|uniref:DUF4153 domain-containing protein n=1 Tax=Marinomonas gallaica TaxID=1806667 RepID=UPI003CE58911
MKLINKLFPLDDLMGTVKRFPLSVLSALSLFVMCILLIHNVVDIEDEFIQRLFVFLGSCYLMFGITRLTAQSQGLSRTKEYSISILCAVGVIALTWLPTLWWMHFYYLVPALLLVLMFAPYIKAGDDLSVWFFNGSMWFGVVVSYVALLLFAGGLCTALWAVHVLFDVNIVEEVYSDIWAFACLVLGPLYALSWVPERFTFNKEDCNAPSGLKFIVNWISAPMVFLYLGVLYAYFIKILVTGEVPNGHLAYMISGFIGAGIITYLLAHPLRDESSPQLRLFYRILFPALIVPVAFHFYAIWERVSAYGVTESRYMLAISAIWFAYLAVAGTLKRLPLRAVPMSLAILMLVATVGPWSAVSVSGQSQKARLETLLVENNILINDKVVIPKSEPSFEARKNISSILAYMCQTKRDELIEIWFTPSKEDTEFQCDQYDLTEEMGFEFVYSFEEFVDENQFRFNSKSYNYKDIAGYDRLIENNYLHKFSDKQAFDKYELTFDNEKTFNVEFNAPNLIVTVADMEPVSLDLKAFAYQLFTASTEDTERNDMGIQGENKDMRYRIEFSHLSGEKHSDNLDLQSISFDFYYKAKN